MTTVKVVFVVNGITVVVTGSEKFVVDSCIVGFDVC